MNVFSVSNLSPLIRKARRNAGLTQLELAQRAGVGKTVVFDIEKGKETVQFDTLLKIIRVLEITLTAEGPEGMVVDQPPPAGSASSTGAEQRD